MNRRMTLYVTGNAVMVESGLSKEDKCVAYNAYEEAEEELQGDQAMQEDRTPSSGHSTRRDSGACADDTLGQAGAVKVKEEPVDSDEDAHIKEMESGEQAAFMQQVIGKDLAPGFVIKVII